MRQPRKADVLFFASLRTLRATTRTSFRAARFGPALGSARSGARAAPALRPPHPPLMQLFNLAFLVGRQDAIETSANVVVQVFDLFLLIGRQSQLVADERRQHRRAAAP